MHPFKRMVLDKESKAQYIPVPPALVRRLNSNAALLFMWLLDMHDIYSKPELNGWFFLVDKNMRETFGWGQDALKAAIDKLVKEGFLEKKRQGVGALVYYKIGSSEAVVSLFSSELGKSKMQGAENPLPPTAELVQNWENPKSETGKPQILNWENPNSDLGKPQIRNGKTPNQILENPNSELGKSHISNNISNKDLNNQTKNKEKEEESADFTNPLPPPDFSEEIKQISFLAAKLAKPENISENIWAYFAALCKSKKKKFTKKGWGAATNKLVEGVAEFGEPAMLEHLENWAESTTWTSPFFKGSAWKDAIRKSNPTAIIENDPRNTAENVSVTKKAFMRIKELYSKLGDGLVPSGGNDFEREKVVLKELWAELLAVTPAQPAEFEEELAIIETNLKAEKAQRSNGKVTTQPKSFIGWIKSKGWLLFAKHTKAAQAQAPTKPQQAPKIAPIAPKAPTAEQTPETPINALQDEDLRLYNVTPDYKVFGDAAERAKAFMGKVFVWDSNETQYSNQETFRKLTGINRRVLLAQKIFDTRAFAEYITKQFGVDYECADKLSKALCYMIPEPHEVIVTQQERAGFPVTDVSKFLTTRSLEA